MTPSGKPSGDRFSLDVLSSQPNERNPYGERMALAYANDLARSEPRDGGFVVSLYFNPFHTLSLPEALCRM